MSEKKAVKISRIHPIEGDGSTKAFCDLVLLDSFVVKGLRVVSGEKGLFVSMPREKGKDEKWYDTFHPLTKEVRDGLQELILEEYANV